MRPVDGRLRFLVQRAFADVADDADDFVRPAPIPENFDLLPDRVHVREILFRHRLVDQQHARFLHVAFVEQPAFQQRDAHRLEIGRRDHAHLHSRFLPGCGCGLPDDLESISRGETGERQITDRADRLHARQGGDAVLRLLEEIEDLVRLGVFLARQLRAHRQHVLGVETGLDGLQPHEAADHQAGADRARRARATLRRRRTRCGMSGCGRRSNRASLLSARRSNPAATLAAPG